ncbi:MAG TPA: hypothetical protein VMF91_05605 [Bryobacteraceae bacterium]|nr:hypothetical protein [Bryobacteraceae bacterium]
MEQSTRTKRRTEPRWPALISLLALAALYESLPERLTPGPSWIVPAAIAALLVPTLAARRSQSHKAYLAFGISLNLVITVAVVWSLGALIAGLPGKREPPAELLRSAVALWISNVLVFAGWYWRLDAGGPLRRELRTAHTKGAFLFPQMTFPPESLLADLGWKPGFVDYLFLAFNTSTAFSPTDVPVLSRWAKLLMMVQSCISLSAIAILAARAINIL